MKKYAALSLLFLLVTSCSQLDTTNGHLETMNQSTSVAADELKQDRQYLMALSTEIKRMADSMSTFEKIGVQLQDVMTQAFAPKTPAKTDDITDVLKGGH